VELKEAFLDFFHFSLPLKEQIKTSEMPVVSVDFEGKVFKEDDRVIRYSWEAENGSWVKAYLIPNERTIYLCNNKFEKYVKRGLLVTINIEYCQYKINSNIIPYLTQNEFTDINSFSKALIESIEKSLNQEKSKEEFSMGKMKERTIELADIAHKLTTICAVSNYGKKMEHVATETGERFGWINLIKDPELKVCYVRFVIDINWETETITYYASMPYTDVVLISYNVFDMCDEPKYRILSINTRAHKCTLFNYNYHTDWMRNMFRWMGEYYMSNEGDIQKINKSKTNEEETTMSELKIKEPVIFNAPATVVFWSDKSKQVLKCREQDEWDEEKALALAIAYKFYGKKEFNKLLKNARRITDDSKAKITVLNTTDKK
jgi:hypothetical protein